MYMKSLNCLRGHFLDDCNQNEIETWSLNPKTERMKQACNVNGVSTPTMQDRKPHEFPTS